MKKIALLGLMVCGVASGAGEMPKKDDKWNLEEKSLIGVFAAAEAQDYKPAVLGLIAHFVLRGVHEYKYPQRYSRVADNTEIGRMALVLKKKIEKKAEHTLSGRE